MVGDVTPGVAHLRIRASAPSSLLSRFPVSVTSANAISQETFCRLRHVSVQLDCNSLHMCLLSASYHPAQSLFCWSCADSSTHLRWLKTPSWWKKNALHFLIDSEFRASQLEHDRDEEVCIKMDELANKNFSHYMMQSEHFRYKQNWWISLKKSGNTGPMRNRSDFNEALSTFNRLHQESGERPTQAHAILEVSAMAPIIEFFLQLVAME